MWKGCASSVTKHISTFIYCSIDWLNDWLIIYHYPMSVSVSLPWNKKKSTYQITSFEKPPNAFLTTRDKQSDWKLVLSRCVFYVCFENSTDVYN